MTRCSVADAKASLPRLINRAMAGEEVVITRHGKAVVELRPAADAAPMATIAAYERLLARRVKLAHGAPTSVALLNLIYDEPEG